MESWQLILVFFIVLMIVRIAPKFLRARKMGQFNPNRSETTFSTSKPNEPKPEIPEKKSESKEMMVLGQIVRDVKTFGEIKRKTKLSSEELNFILESLENRGLMTVVEKKGPLGSKVQLLPTPKGYREYSL